MLEAIGKLTSSIYAEDISEKSNFHEIPYTINKAKIDSNPYPMM